MTGPFLASDVMLGASFHGFVRACLNLHVISGEAVARLIADIEVDGWYPISDFMQLQETVWADYRDPVPIMERAGEEFIRVWYAAGGGAVIDSGIGFLRFQAGSQGYASAVRGDLVKVGRFELAELDEAGGTATVISTTPFRGEFEKGLLLQGVLVPGDISYAEIVREGPGKTFRIAFRKGAPTFASRLAGLPGAGLADASLFGELVWRYRSLAAQYARDQAFWRATNVTLEEFGLRALRMSATFEKQATTDPVTGLASRRRFVAAGESEFHRARRFGHPLSLLLLDIDRFKLINDNHGHPVGDRLLATFARACAATLRDIDLLGRLGGDEFAVLLVETGLEGAREVAERLRRTIEELVVDVGGAGRHIRVTSSIGVAGQRPDDVSFEDLVARADAALYVAKRAGRNRVA